MRVLVNIGVVILVLLTLLPQTPVPNSPAIMPNMVAKAASALSNRVQPRVIGGAIADVTQLGGYVSIMTPKNWCNGALIHPEWVITTIACIHDMGNRTQTPVPTSTAIPNDGKVGIFSPAQITVNVGCAMIQNYTCRMDSVLEQVYGSKSQKFKVSSIHVHPNRGENIFVSGLGTWPDPTYDVVLLHLDGQVQVGPGIIPFTLGQVDDDISDFGQPLVVSTGYWRLRPIPTSTVTNTPKKPSKPTQTVLVSNTPTRTSFPYYLDMSNHVRIASLNIIDSSACAFPRYNTETHSCVDPTSTNVNVCYGDQGAPIVAMQGDQYVLFGLSLSRLQFGFADACTLDAPSTFLKLTAPVIHDWIEGTINSNRSQSLRAEFGGIVGFGDTQLAIGDDVVERIDVSDVFTSGIRIGNTVSQILSVSNNGVVGLGEIAELPANLPSLKGWLGSPLIAPFAADVDTRSGAMRPLAGTKTSGANAVWVDQDVSSHQVTITWDDVRPYPDTSRIAVSNSFQLQLTALTPSITKVTFLYDAIQWTYGENSCGQPCDFKKAQHAQVGISAGDGKTAWTHKASGKASNLRQLAETVTVYLFDGKIHTTLPIERPTSVLPATSTTVATAVPLPDGSGPSTDGLLAWYPLNGIRTTGSTLPVQASTIMGATQYFDGVNDYHQTTIDLANTSFTVAFWAAFDWKDRYQLVVGGGSVANANQGLMIGGIKDLAVSSTAATFYCGFYQNDLYYELPESFNQTAWHHYACTYDKNTQVRKIIIDGVVVKSDSSVAPLQTTSEFWLGRSPWNNAFFKGSLRDVMVYNRALGKNEINHIKDITPNSIMLSEPHPASACRWVDKGGMVHEYEINQDLLTWEQAQAAAQARTRGGQPGYLATITSAVENECVAQLMGLHAGGQGAWFGGKRESAGGVFVWQGGPERGMNIASSASMMGYEQWNSGEPSVDEDALYFISSESKQWNNLAGTAYSAQSIIEYTYPQTSMISGVLFEDTNKNALRDTREKILANTTITLTTALAQPVTIVAGANQHCSLLEDGRVVCWGRRGDIWRWDQQSAVPIEVDGWASVKQVATGALTTCALLRDDTVSCLGDNSTGAVGDGSGSDQWSPVPVANLSGVRALHSGAGRHHCAVLLDGTVKCWGDNTYGQLGDGSLIRRNTPVPVVGLTGVAQVSIGAKHSCALKQDGTVWCWGNNESAQLASASISESLIPVQIGAIKGATALQSGNAHSCVILKTALVSCWGDSAAITGVRGGTVVQVTAIAGTENMRALAMGAEQSCALKSDGSVWCWGHVFHGEAGWVASGPTTTQRTSAQRMDSVGTVQHIALSAGSGCGLRADGAILCWGEADKGQLGDGTYQPLGIATDVRVTWQTNPYAARVAKVVSSDWSRCAILTDRRVACWGSNHPWWSSDPDTTLEPRIIQSLTDVIDINMGMGNYCALKRNGTVWCWGTKMVADQFVNGVTTTETPQMHKQRDVVALSSGNKNSIRCFTMATGTVTCYVVDSTGVAAYQLPTGNTFSGDIGAIEHGFLSSCSLKQATGEVWCWGDNQYAQLGIGISNIQTSVPQKVVGIQHAQRLSSSDWSSCVIRADTNVYCWGMALRIDGVGTGADGSPGVYPTFIAIPNTTGMRKISSGWMTCGVKFDGTVWCWGMKKWTSVFDENSQLLEGTLVPFQIIGVTNAVDVNSSATSVCVLLRTGETRCWGEGATGMLGNGTNALTWIPRAISEPWQADVNRGCEWVDWQGRRHSYESLSGSWTWTQARDMAATRTWRGTNGYLATITSPEENRCVHQLMLRQETSNSGLNGWYPARWLGGSDAESEGTWKWMTGPEIGTVFREIQRDNYPQAGLSQFQKVSHSGCKPNCATPTDWDYTRMIFPYGTHIQRNQWDDQLNADPIGAIVEYTTGIGEQARTYMTQSDSQGNYTLSGLTPGWYELRVANGKSVVTRMVWIGEAGQSLVVNMNVAAKPPAPQPNIGTPTPTATKYTMPSLTPSYTPTSTKVPPPSKTKPPTRTPLPSATPTALPRPLPQIYGDGHDGDLIINGSVTVPSRAQIRNLSTSVSAGAGTLSLNADCSGFVSANDEVLIHQTIGGQAGQYEFVLVKTCVGQTLTTWDPLQYAYTTSSGVVQIMKVHNYNTVTVTNGSITAEEWDGSTGGIVVLKARQSATIAGIDVMYRGYRGGAYGNYGNPNADGQQGESMFGTGSRTSSRNYLAGGGGRGDNGAGGGGSGGGGGSYTFRGSNGTKGQGSAGGEYGYSVTDLNGSFSGGYSVDRYLLLGSGGGGGGANDGSCAIGGAGGDGAGSIVIHAALMNIQTITITGSNGGNAAQCTGSGEGGGGGGSGGGLYIRGNQVSINTVMMGGGNGGAAKYGAGGYGSDGYAVVAYCTVGSVANVIGRTTGYITPQYQVALCQ